MKCEEFKHDWGFKVNNVMFNSEGDVDRWIRENKINHNVKSIQTCKRCGQAELYTISRRGRGRQKLGFKRRAKVGTQMNHSGERWFIRNICRSMEEAIRYKESGERFTKNLLEKYGVGGLNGSVKEYKYTIIIRIWTKTYGQVRIPRYFVLRREVTW